MKIQISLSDIKIDQHSLPYDRYYFFEFPATQKSFESYLHVIKHVLSQWADSLDQKVASEAPIYLPFSIDDQTVDCLEITGNGPRANVSVVTVRADATEVNLDNLQPFIFGTYEVLRRERQLGEFSKTEFASALRDAEMEWKANERRRRYS